MDVYVSQLLGSSATHDEFYTSSTVIVSSTALSAHVTSALSEISVRLPTRTTSKHSSHVILMSLVSLVGSWPTSRAALVLLARPPLRAPVPPLRHGPKRFLSTSRVSILTTWLLSVMRAFSMSLARVHILTKLARLLVLTSSQTWLSRLLISLPSTTIPAHGDRALMRHSGESSGSSTMPQLLSLLGSLLSWKSTE